MVALDFYWKKDKNYLIYDYEKLSYKPKEDAPQDIWDSYNHYIEQLNYYRKKEEETGAHII